MGELTNEIPKPLLKISGRPIVEYTLRNLPDKISEIIFIIGYKGEMIKKHFGDKFGGKKITYVEQKELNGTGGAVFNLKSRLKDRFLVLNGDDIYRQDDLGNLLPHGLALLVKRIAKNDRFGTVEIDKRGNLKSIIEFRNLPDKNAAGNLVNMGAYLLNVEIFKYPLVAISEKEFGLPQTMAQMADEHKIKVIEAKIWHANTKGEDLIEAEKVVKKYFKIN